MLRRRKSIFLTLWLSYILILIIPVTVSAGLYTGMEKTMIGNASRSNLAMLEQVRQIVDNHLQEIDQMIVQIATHPKLQTLWTIEESEKYIQYEEAVGALKNIRSGTGFIDDFFIHLRKQDVILTPSLKTDTETFFTKLYPFGDKDLSQVRSELLSGYHFKTFWPVTQIKQDSIVKNVIMCEVSLPLGEKDNVWGTLVMLIEDQQIFDLLKQIEWANRGSMYIMDDTGNVILSTSDRGGLPKGLQKEIVNGGNGYKSYDADGTASMLSYTTGQSGWKYVSLVPKDVVLARINQMKDWALTLLGLVVVAGTIAAYWMAYRSYSPIRDMVYAFLNGKKEQKPALGNEYEFIKNSIVQTMAEGKELKEKLEGHIPVVRTYFLYRLLKNQTEPAALEQQSLDFMDIKFPHDHVCVILIEVDDSSEFIRDGSEREWALVRFILFNLSSELVGDRGYVTETERNRLALLLHMPDDGEEAKRERDGLAAELKRLVEERFRMKVSVGLSSIRKSLPEASRCYEEALNALDYRIIHGISSVIHYERIGEAEQEYYHYPIETEAQLINYMKSGEYDDAGRLLDELYERNVTKRAMTPEMGKTLFFDLLSTMLKVMSALKIEDRLLNGSASNPVKHIAGSRSAEEMHKQIKALCREICDSVREARTNPNGRLNERIKRYIEENNADNGLSLTAIADYFGMTPQYISGFFKKMNGVNLTDYMADVRIERAKRMLADPHMTVLQIAQQVGYATDIGFIRVFKKIEGITPGKYRETLLQSQEMKNG